MSEGGDDPTFIIVLVILVAAALAVCYFLRDTEDAPSGGGGYTPQKEASYQQRARAVIADFDEQERYARMSDDDPRKIQKMVADKLKWMDANGS